MFHVNQCKEVADGKTRLPQFPDVIYAGHSSEKQSKIVEEMRGTLDVASIKEMAKQIRMNSNLHTVIFDLTTGDISVANRHGALPAANCPYVEFPSDAWNRD